MRLKASVTNVDQLIFEMLRNTGNPTPHDRTTKPLHTNSLFHFSSVSELTFDSLFSIN